MYKNVLVISDNAYLSDKLFNLLKQKNFKQTQFSLAISPFSNVSDFFKKPIVLDLKKQENIKKISEHYDLVISVHCKQIFPADLVNSVKCINVHPGYNPINRGWYPQVFSILYDLPVGATIHEIDEQLDHGPIIARAFVDKENFDTSESLYHKIINKELELFENHIDSIISNKYATTIPEENGNLFLKKDFNDQLHLNLDETSSLHEFIKRLRALSHGNFNNAYYIDSVTGKKVFVSITLTPEDNE